MTRNWIAFFLAAALWLPLLSCSTYHKPMETVVRDSLYISQRMIDRVLIGDSVLERQVHDTIYRYRERETVRYLSLRDTMYIEKRDSVSVPYPVERELTKWEAARMRMGDILLVSVNIVLIYVVIWMIRRRER